MNRNVHSQGRDELANDIDAIHAIADATRREPRVLADMELGWVAGGDGEPVWPY
ncbi:MAG TPA: hypothetical protein VF038_00760 [Usitatibacter sp.]|jgi:hypothetical protein